MRTKFLVFTFLAAILIALFCTHQVDISKAEMNPLDLQVVIYNRNSQLSGAEYESHTIDGTDYYEFDYIEGMLLSFSSKFVNSAIIVEQTQVRVDGIFSSDYTINKAGNYALTVAATYMVEGSPRLAEKAINITIKKLPIEIQFIKTQKFYNDGSGGAVAHYIDQPSSVLNSSLKIAYYEDESLTLPIGGVPINAGTYYVNAYYQDTNNPNYIAANTSTFIIDKSQAAMTATDKTETYFDEVFNLAESMNLQITGELTDRSFVVEVLDEGVWTTKDVIDAGEYFVRFSFLGEQDNYEQPFSETYSFVVEKAHVYFDVTEDIGIAYSGGTPNLIALFGEKILLYNAHTQAQITDNYGELSVRYFDLDDNDIDAPAKIGKYKFCIKSEGTDNYIVKESDRYEFEITKIPIFFDYEGNYDPVRHRIIQSYNGEDVSIQYSLLDNNHELITEEIEQENIVYYALPQDTKLGTLPSMPGLYRANIIVETQHFYGNTQIELYIEHIDLPVDIDIFLDDIKITDFDNIQIEYQANPITFVAAVDAEYGIDGYVIEYEGVEDTQYELTTNAPQHAGRYKVIVSLNDDIYQKTIHFEFDILKKEVTITAKNQTVQYGEKLYIVTNALSYQAKDVQVDGLAKGDRVDSLLPYIRILIDDRLTQTDPSIIVGTYSLKVELRTDIPMHASYIINILEASTLEVTKRDLFVKMNDSVVITGNSVIPTISGISGFAYQDSENINSIKSSISWYYKNDEQSFESIPNGVGEYAIVATGTHANYTIVSINGTLIVSSGVLKDSNNSGLELVGKFAGGEELKIIYGNVTNEIKAAIKENFDKHEALRVYEVRVKAVTADDTRFKVRINISGFGDSGNYKVLAKYGNIYTELEFTQDGDTIEINEQVLADMYIFCGVAKFNWLWVILIGSIVLIVSTIVGVILRIYLTGGFKKKYEDTAKSVSVQSVRVKSEVDELDELIEAFDESTVVRELTPAERLEQKQKEEKYEQYRLKLQRLRSIGDKALEDSLRQSGVKYIDDDIIIQKMIKDDEERMRKIEEEIQREKEEEEKEKEKPIAVILPKSNESYEQKTFAPKTKIDDDDFDI